MKFKYVIFSPSYSENNGGAVTLHHLCDLINANGNECYLYPGFDNFELNILNYKNTLKIFIGKLLKKPFGIFKTSNRFNTPVLKKFPGKLDLKETIVIYPEIVFGNPLNASNVVRWLLNDPGFFTGKIYYGQNEIYFKYDNQYKDFTYLNSSTSKNNLYIFTYLKHLYNDNGIVSNKNGIAYCIRKGRIKNIPLDLSQAVLIDGMKHKDISNIFKRVEYFISFDPHTAFSRFAALCGCVSIVVPIDGVGEDEWQPDKEKRYGVSYGFEDEMIKKAMSTIGELKGQLIRDEENSMFVVQTFIDEVETFFLRTR